MIPKNFKGVDRDKQTSPIYCSSILTNLLQFYYKQLIQTYGLLMNIDLPSTSTVVYFFGLLIHELSSPSAKRSSCTSSAVAFSS